MYQSGMLVLVAFVFLAKGVFAQPQDKGPVTSELTAVKVLRQADGKEVLEPATRVKPGDVIEYKAVYRNRGKFAIRDLTPRLPIPQGMEYIPGTARPEQVRASLDGEKFAPVPLKLAVKLPNGRTELREVPYSEYRFLEWNLGGLAAGDSSAVVVRVRVISNVKPASQKERSQ